MRTELLGLAAGLGIGVLAILTSLQTGHYKAVCAQASARSVETLFAPCLASPLPRTQGLASGGFTNATPSG